MRIAVDLDDTLWKLVEDTDREPDVHVGAMCACGMPVRQVPDPDIKRLVHSLALDPDNAVFIWSAGGVEYVKDWIKRFAPAWGSLVDVIPKEEGHNIDITIDDQEITLGRINLRVKRIHSDHWLQEEEKD